MLTAEREQAIRDLLNLNGTMKIIEFCDDFQIALVQMDKNYCVLMISAYEAIKDCLSEIDRLRGKYESV